MRYLNGKVSIPTWGGLSKAKLKAVTAGAGDVLKGKVIVDANGNPLTGVIESGEGQTITPTTAAQTVSCNGKYMTGDIKINGDSNLVAANIVSGKSIFGVAGNARKYGFINKWANTGSTAGFRDVADKATYNKYYVEAANIGFTPESCYAIYNTGNGTVRVTGYIYNPYTYFGTYVVAGDRDYKATSYAGSFSSSLLRIPVYTSGGNNILAAGYY
ncbi:MAG: hypothetical protein MR011_06360 [Lachnospiraceae bacterium]|nr:hypothetical protein [Lachnospiraceae bacterium]